MSDSKESINSNHNWGQYSSRNIRIQSENSSQPFKILNPFVITTNCNGNQQQITITNRSGNTKSLSESLSSIESETHLCIEELDTPSNESFQKLILEDFNLPSKSTEKSTGDEENKTTDTTTGKYTASSSIRTEDNILCDSEDDAENYQREYIVVNLATPPFNNSFIHPEDECFLYLSIFPGSTLSYTLRTQSDSSCQSSLISENKSQTSSRHENTANLTPTFENKSCNTSPTIQIISPKIEKLSPKVEKNSPTNTSNTGSTSSEEKSTPLTPRWNIISSCRIRTPKVNRIYPIDEISEKSENDSIEADKIVQHAKDIEAKMQNIFLTASAACNRRPLTRRSAWIESNKIEETEKPDELNIIEDHFSLPNQMPDENKCITIIPEIPTSLHQDNVVEDETNEITIEKNPDNEDLKEHSCCACFRWLIRSFQRYEVPPPPSPITVYTSLPSEDDPICSKCRRATASF